MNFNRRRAKPTKDEAVDPEDSTMTATTAQPISLTRKPADHKAESANEKLPGIKDIIAVASGLGKTIAVVIGQEGPLVHSAVTVVVQPVVADLRPIQ